MHALHADFLRSLEAAGPAPAPEDRQLLDQVVGAGGTVAGWLSGGLTTALGLRSLAALAGLPPARCRAILDFGCGSGRVLRWMGDLARAGCRLDGVDIHAPAITFAKRAVRHGSMRRIDPRPPLPFRDGSYDLVFAISVLTHLDEEHGAAWLDELTRVLAPGGLALLSVHGEAKARRMLPPAELERFLRDGFYFQRPSHRDSTLAGLPAFYQVAFHHDSRIEATWTRRLDLLFRAKNGPFFEQELVILRKPRPDEAVGSPERARRPNLDLPLVCLELPEVDSRTDPDTGSVASGWAFRPGNARPVDLDVWVAGERVGRVETGIPRPDVRDVFQDPAADSSGFRFPFPASRLADGPSAVWVTEAGGPPVPLGSGWIRIGDPAATGSIFDRIRRSATHLLGRG